MKPSVAMAKLKPFNPDPNNLKRIPDSAQQLLDELQGLGVNTPALESAREKPLPKSNIYFKTISGNLTMLIIAPVIFSWGRICFAGSRFVTLVVPYCQGPALGNLDDLQLVAETFSTYVSNSLTIHKFDSQ